MVEPLRHRQTKGAATDMPGLPPPRQIPTLPSAEKSRASSSAIWSWWFGGVGGEPPVSVAAVAARRVDHLQLLKVEFGNR